MSQRGHVPSTSSRTKQSPPRAAAHTPAALPPAAGTAPAAPASDAPASAASAAGGAPAASDDPASASAPAAVPAAAPAAPAPAAPAAPAAAAVAPGAPGPSAPALLDACVGARSPEDASMPTRTARQLSSSYGSNPETTRFGRKRSCGGAVRACACVCCWCGAWLLLRQAFSPPPF
jgi:hypothetical protein